ncbi:hypothetical protein C9F11_46655 (plasmid) [Streptomyces sp. YIM 121038]|nr:hypothetical protein C9F11_46655 [Streptomyces sp. YIM 121038]
MSQIGNAAILAARSPGRVPEPHMPPSPCSPRSTASIGLAPTQPCHCAARSAQTHRVRIAHGRDHTRPTVTRTPHPRLILPRLTPIAPSHSAPGLSPRRCPPLQLHLIAYSHVEEQQHPLRHDPCLRGVHQRVHQIRTAGTRWPQGAQSAPAPPPTATNSPESSTPAADPFISTASALLALPPSASAVDPKLATPCTASASPLVNGPLTAFRPRLPPPPLLPWPTASGQLRSHAYPRRPCRSPTVPRPTSRRSLNMPTSRARRHLSAAGMRASTERKALLEVPYGPTLSDLCSPHHPGGTVPAGLSGMHVPTAVGLGKPATPLCATPHRTPPLHTPPQSRMDTQPHPVAEPEDPSSPTALPTRPRRALCVNSPLLGYPSPSPRPPRLPRPPRPAPAAPVLGPVRRPSSRHRDHRPRHLRRTRVDRIHPCMPTPGLRRTLPASALTMPRVWLAFADPQSRRHHRLPLLQCSVAQQLVNLPADQQKESSPTAPSVRPHSPPPDEPYALCTLTTPTARHTRPRRSPLSSTDHCRSSRKRRCFSRLHPPMGAARLPEAFRPLRQSQSVPRGSRPARRTGPPHRHPTAFRGRRPHPRTSPPLIPSTPPPWGTRTRV